MPSSSLRGRRSAEPATLPAQRGYISRSPVQYRIICTAATMMAQVTGLKAGEFIHTLGDAHIYLNHLDQVKLQLSREPRALPQMKINPDVKSIYDFQFEDFELVNYDPHPHIAGIVAV